LNQFSDLTPAQFAAKHLTLRAKDVPTEDAPVITNLPNAAAGGIDWRDHNVVTPVKDQGQCGSCWAFSVTETVESAYAIQRNTTPPVLAPEQLVDCDKTDWGCEGGIADYAWKYTVKAGGLMKEADYPYVAGKTGKAGVCKFAAAKIAAPVKSFKFIGTPCQYVGDSCDHQDDNLVQNALLTMGPLGICVNANWQDYKSGVFSGSCAHDAAHINHAVQLVGFNADQKYWIVRNSWSTTWGSSGYIYIKQNKNLCGVANIVSFPSTV